MEKTKRLKQLTKKVLRHWATNINAVTKGKRIKMTAIGCSYCQYFREERDLDCDFCPVFEDTGIDYCEATPYIELCHDRRNIDLVIEEFQYLLNVAYCQDIVPDEWKEMK